MFQLSLKARKKPIPPFEGHQAGRILFYWMGDQIFCSFQALIIIRIATLGWRTLQYEENYLTNKNHFPTWSSRLKNWPQFFTSSYVYAHLMWLLFIFCFLQQEVGFPFPSLLFELTMWLAGNRMQHKWQSVNSDPRAQSLESLPLFTLNFVQLPLKKRFSWSAGKWKTTEGKHICPDKVSPTAKSQNVS